MDRRFWTVAALAAGVAMPAVARAGGTELAEQSPVAAATGGAGTARDGDASAAWYVPAALADGRGFRAGVGLLLALSSVTAADLDGAWTTASETRVSPPPHLYLSYADADWAAGLAVNVPFGGGVTWPEGWEGRFEIRSSSLEVFRVAPFFAWRFGELRVGGGLHVDVGRLRIARDLDFVDTAGTVQLDLSGVGIGVHLSAWWEASPELALGLAFRSRSTLGLDGGADFEGIPDAFAARAHDQLATASLPLPDRVALGGRWRRARVSVLADVALVFWDRYDALRIDLEDPFTPDVEQITDWRLAASMRAGVEYALRPNVTLRAGAFLDPTPVPAETLAPSSPDSTRIGGSVGGGLTLGSGFRLDASYSLLLLLARDSESADALRAGYSGVAHLLCFGLVYDEPESTR